MAVDINLETRVVDVMVKSEKRLATKEDVSTFVRVSLTAPHEYMEELLQYLRDYRGPHEVVDG